MVLLCSLSLATLKRQKAHVQQVLQPLIVTTGWQGTQMEGLFWSQEARFGKPPANGSPRRPSQERLPAGAWLDVHELVDDVEVIDKHSWFMMGLIPQKRSGCRLLPWHPTHPSSQGP